MIKKTDKDVLGLLKDFQKNILSNRPPLKTMVEEVRMMRFKIRPIQGDISLFNFSDKRLIEILWSLGKLDDFFQREFKDLTFEQKETFFRFFDDVYKQFQEQLNKMSPTVEKKIDGSSVLEMEVFKEKLTKKKAN